MISGAFLGIFFSDTAKTSARVFLGIIFTDIMSHLEMNCTCLETLRFRFLSNALTSQSRSGRISISRKRSASTTTGSSTQAGHYLTVGIVSRDSQSNIQPLHSLTTFGQNHGHLRPKTSKQSHTAVVTSTALLRNINGIPPDHADLDDVSRSARQMLEFSSEPAMPCIRSQWSETNQKLLLVTVWSGRQLPGTFRKAIIVAFLSERCIVGKETKDHLQTVHACGTKRISLVTSFQFGTCNSAFS